MCFPCPAFLRKPTGFLGSPYQRVYLIVNKPCPQTDSKYKGIVTDGRRISKNLPWEKDGDCHKQKKSKLEKYRNLNMKRKLYCKNVAVMKQE